MPRNYGNIVAGYVENGIARVGPGGWTALIASSSRTVPLARRQWIRIQAKGRNALALLYANKNADGTFTAPTETAHRAVTYPGNSVIIEPLGDTVMVYGRCIAKAGSTDGGLRVIVTEYQ